MADDAGGEPTAAALREAALDQLFRGSSASSNTIFIAEILAVESRGGAPLLYFERSFTGRSRDG